MLEFFLTGKLHNISFTKKKGGYSNQTKTMYAKKNKALGVRIVAGVEVKGFTNNISEAISLWIPMEIPLVSMSLSL